MSNRGRPTIYSKELADKICDAVATSTLGLRKLCKLHPDFPDPDTIFKWRYRYNDFNDQYVKAKQFQADIMAEEIIEIADDGLNDTYVNDEGQVKVDNDVIQRSRLRVDTRKWIACKLLPKIYGNNTTKDSDDNQQEEGLKELE